MAQAYEDDYYSIRPLPIPTSSSFIKYVRKLRELENVQIFLQKSAQMNAQVRVSNFIISASDSIKYGYELYI